MVEGFYKNSSAPMEDLKFESLVDIFTFNNAKNFSITLMGEKMEFTRTMIDVSRNTKMNFVMIGTNMSRTAVVQMDRTPNQALKENAFYGNLVINNPIYEFGFESRTILPRHVTYNFYCTF
jgi:hypothetical protein